MAPHPARVCFSCGASTALALSEPGHYSKRRRKGYLAYCPDHEQNAFERRDAALGVARPDGTGAMLPQPKPGKGGAVSADAPASKQGELF